MQERGGSLRIHAGALHFPHGAVCRPQTDDRFRQQADGSRHRPELGGFPHPGIALNHREPIRSLQYHPGGSTLP